MRAILMTAAGGPEVLEYTEIEEPEIARDTQIKVRLRAAGVNPIDTKLRGRGVFFDDALPAVLGCDGAGEVVEAGSASGFVLGDRVAFCHGGLGEAQGNYAEYTVLEGAEAAAIPDNVNFDQAAALPLALITAWESLYDRARLEKGQDLLVIGATGGVGHLAVQLGSRMGARVLATASSPEKAWFAGEMGASEIIRHDEASIPEATRRLTDGHGADVVFDAVGGPRFNDAIASAAYRGDLVTLLAPPAEADWKAARTRNLRVGFDLMLTPMLQHLPEARAHQVDILHRGLDFLESRDLEVRVSETLPLQEAAEAHRMIESGHTQGKIVLSMD